MTMSRLRLGQGSRHGWLLLLAAVFAAACGESPVDDDPDAAPEEMPDPPPDPDVRSAYLDIYLDPGMRICPPTLDRLDAEVERLAEALGVDADPEERIVLHYGDWSVKERCDVEFEVGEFMMGGCAQDDGLWVAAQPGAETHEFVHNLRVREGFYGPPYWEEGLATYYGTYRPYGPNRVWAASDLHPSQSLYSAAEPDDADYSESAHFIAFIDRTYGSERLRDLSRSLGEGLDPGEAFTRTLGASLESVETRWKAEADHMYELGPICEADIVVGAEPVVIRGEIGCDVPGVIGPGPNRRYDVFRGPRHCLQTPPDTTLTVTVRSSFEDGMAEAYTLASDACPAHEPNPGGTVAPDTSRDFETRGCTWSVAYVSSLEGDEYEIELVVQ